jgi:quinol monooxygenase YgiN
MEVVVIVRYRARAGAEARVAAALRNMAGPSRGEPGNLEYRIFTDPADPAVFVLYERYADSEAAQAHRDTPHFATWLLGEVLPNLDERTRFDLVPFEARY